MTFPRIVFLGSPAFAVPSLRALAPSVVGVVTQPDRPAGRGRRPAPCAVKVAAQELGLPVIQPEKMALALDQLRAWQPDLIVVAAFGKILRPHVLALPALGCLNVHASLLPRYRGAAPIPAAILAGDAEAGITLMKMDEGLDTGPTMAQRAIPIEPGDTTATLTPRLAILGADLLRETLPAILTGEPAPIPQNAGLATYAPQLKKEDGLLRFGDTAQSLERRVRAMNDWPGAYVLYHGAPLKILRAHAQPAPAADQGRVVRIGSLPAIGATGGLLVLDEVQPAGKKPMSAASFLNGNPNFVGSQL
ncbi:MAG: methionyl-tRNA formyltransferase [Chloroflexi bacterium]|nr:methionyl-tRNA formyltransferase [Chloroflexota bacterium]